MLDCFQTTKATAREEPSAKVGRQGSKQAEGRRPLQELPIKDDVQVGASVCGNFSGPREKSSILQQGNPASPGPLVLFTAPHSAAGGCNTGAEARVRPHTVPMGDGKKLPRRVGRVTAPGNQTVQSREKESNSIYTFTKTHEMHVPVICLSSDLLLERLSPLQFNCKRKWS